MTHLDHGAARATAPQRAWWWAWRVVVAAPLAVAGVGHLVRGGSFWEAWPLLIWAATIPLYVATQRMTYVMGYGRGQVQAYMDVGLEVPGTEVVARAKPHPADPYPVPPVPDDARDLLA